MKNRQCYKDVKGKESVYSIVSQLAITDTNTEGVFIDHYTETQIGYLPRAQDRPQKKTTNYNCVRVTVEAKALDGKYGERQQAEIWDGNCGVEECALCGLPKPVAKMRVRGLCKVGSLFDKEYYYIILENGTQAYLGRHTSLILFNADEKQWSWTDSEDSISRGKF